MKKPSWMMIFALLISFPAMAEEVATVNLGFLAQKKIIVEHFQDPVLKGVSCYVSHVHSNFSAANPSDMGLACYQTAPVTQEMIAEVKGREKKEIVFERSMSVATKKQKVARIWDRKNSKVIYISYSQKTDGASDKHDIATVFLRVAKQGSDGG